MGALLSHLPGKLSVESGLTEQAFEARFRVMRPLSKSDNELLKELVESNKYSKDPKNVRECPKNAHEEPTNADINNTDVLYIGIALIAAGCVLASTVACFLSHRSATAAVDECDPAAGNESRV